jgi:hypothetical protein
MGSEGDPVTINTTMTEADFSGKELGVAGAQILAAFNATGTVLAKLTFGDGDSGWIKWGTNNFEVGQPVDYGGRQCIVSEVNDWDSVTFRFPVTVDTTMTEADFSGADLGPSDAMILAAWLEHKVRQSTARLSVLRDFAHRLAFCCTGCRWGLGKIDFRRRQIGLDQEERLLRRQL